MQLHANAALSLNKRRQLCRRVVEESWSLGSAAAAAGVSGRTAAKWVRRYRPRASWACSIGPRLRGGSRIAPTSDAWRRSRRCGGSLHGSRDRRSARDGALDRLGGADADRDGKLGRLGLASSAPCSPAGPTARSIAPAQSAPPPLTAGSGTTTIDDDTAPSATNPRSLASTSGTTSSGLTTRRGLLGGAVVPSDGGVVPARGRRRRKRRLARASRRSAAGQHSPRRSDADRQLNPYGGVHDTGSPTLARAGWRPFPRRRAGFRAPDPRRCPRRRGARASRSMT